MPRALVLATESEPKSTLRKNDRRPYEGHTSAVGLHGITIGTRIRERNGLVASSDIRGCHAGARADLARGGSAVGVVRLPTTQLGSAPDCGAPSPAN